MSFSSKCFATEIGSMPLEDYVQYIPQMIKNGATLIGGCCGTNLAYSKRMPEIIKQ